MLDYQLIYLPVYTIFMGKSRIISHYQWVTGVELGFRGYQDKRQDRSIELPSFCMVYGRTVALYKVQICMFLPLSEKFLIN